MIYIDRLTLLPFDGISVHTNIVGRVMSDKPVELLIQKSDAPGGPWFTVSWHKLNSGDFEISFVDFSSRYIGKRAKDYFYRLRAISEDRDVVIGLDPDIQVVWDDSGLYPTDWTELSFSGATPPFRVNIQWEVMASGPDRRHSLYRFKIVQRLRLAIWRRLYKEGILMFAIPVSTAYGRCRFCWDPVKETRIATHCPYCLDTGWAQPFAVPVPTYGVITKPQESPKMTVMGEQQIEVVNILIPALPELRPREDYVYVPMDGKFYKVLAVDRGLYENVPTQQLIQAQATEPNTELNRLISELWEHYEKYGVYPWTV